MLSFTVEGLLTHAFFYGTVKVFGERGRQTNPRTRLPYDRSTKAKLLRLCPTKEEPAHNTQRLNCEFNDRRKKEKQL